MLRRFVPKRPRQLDIKFLTGVFAVSSVNQPMCQDNPSKFQVRIHCFVFSIVAAQLFSFSNPLCFHAENSSAVVLACQRGNGIVATNETQANNIHERPGVFQTAAFRCSPAVETSWQNIGSSFRRWLCRQENSFKYFWQCFLET
jgi:hypothetical protein